MEKAKQIYKRYIYVVQASFYIIPVHSLYFDGDGRSSDKEGEFLSYTYVYLLRNLGLNSVSYVFQNLAL